MLIYCLYFGKHIPISTMIRNDEEGGGYADGEKYGGGKSQKPALYGGSGCQLKYCFYFSSDFKS